MFTRAIIPFPETSVVDTLSDKCSLLKLARSLEIPFPHTLHVDNVTINADKLDTVSYPVVLKPGKSWLEHNGKWIQTSVRFASCASEVNQIIHTDPAFQAHPFMLQECISGWGEGIFAAYDHGKPVAFFAHRRLREKPPHGGVSVLSESIETNPKLLYYAQSLLDHVGWHGIAMVEFRISRTGKPYLMEVNTRFWGSLQLAVDSGVDFPWLIYQISCENKIKSIDHYKTGVRLRWLLGDLDSLYLTVRDQQYSVAEKISAILRFLTPHPLRTRHEVDRWDDLGPCWWELKQYIRDIL
jgi:predicted ATP-grasp superfamily ATP-dependent carboligase